MGLFGKKKLKDGVRGTGRVVSTTFPNANAAYVNIRMTLIVEADGVPPTSVEYRQGAVRTKKWPSPGQVLPVEVDRADPQKVKVLWGEVPTTTEWAQAQADALAASVRGERGARPTSLGELPAEASGIVDQIKQAFPGATVNVDGAGGTPGGAPAGSDDRIAQLERLAKLRDQGVLSQNEFEAEKARILGGR